MTIESAYIFKLVEMKRFNLPSQDYEITSVDSVIESLYQVKVTYLFFVIQIGDKKGTNTYLYRRLPSSCIIRLSNTLKIKKTQEIAQDLFH